MEGMLLGIVLGGLLVLVLAALAVIWLLRMAKRWEREERELFRSLDFHDE